MIKLENINKSYDGKTVLKNFNLQIKKGERLVLMGESGCGKTTIASLIAGLISSDSGKVTLEGKISFVFQEDRLLEHLTAIENLNLVNNNQEKNKRILETLGLEDDINQPTKILSGGMKRRVAIGRALTYPHDILILDEPFKGLDLERKKKTIDLIKTIEQGKTLLLITHQVEEAQALNCKIVSL